MYFRCLVMNRLYKCMVHRLISLITLVIISSTPNIIEAYCSRQFSTSFRYRHFGSQSHKLIHTKSIYKLSLTIICNSLQPQDTETLSEAELNPIDNDYGLLDNLESNVDVPPSSVDVSIRKPFESLSIQIQSIPEETLYIIDGNCLFHDSYHSKISKKSEYVNSKFPIELSRNLRNYTSTLIKSNDFYSLDPNATDTHIPSNALIVFAIRLRRLIETVKPRYLVVVFDMFAKTFRHDIYPEYKSNRKQHPEALLSQLFLAPLVANALGCHCFQKKGYEGDDVMASLSKWATNRGLNVVHVTSDKDMLQLIGKGVHVLNLRASKIITPHDVKSKFSVEPHALCDYQALVGDLTDNIRGIYGIGPKSASFVLKRFKTLDKVFEYSNLFLKNDEACHPFGFDMTDTPPGIRGTYSKLFKTLVYGHHTALFNLKLVTLVSDLNIIPLPVPWKIPRNVLGKRNRAQYEKACKWWLCTMVRNLVEKPNGIEEFVNYIFDDEIKYTVTWNEKTNRPSIAFSSLSLRYTGASIYAEDLFSLFGIGFTRELKNLRRIYHLLDRQV